MDWFAELNEIMPPPALEMREGVPDAGQWQHAETQLGVAFPDDFKQFLNHWGEAWYGRFFFVYSPASAAAAVRLPDAVEGPAQAYSALKSHHPDQFSLPHFPNAGSLMTCAVTDNGDYIGWIIDPAKPADTWPVAVWGDEDAVPQVFDGIGFGPFMVSLIKGDIRPEAFPDALWDTVPLQAEAIPDGS